MSEAKKNQARSGFQMFASFKLGDSELSLPISSLQEVVNYPEKLNQVPLAPEYLVGLFNLRGLVIPIVDVSQILKISSTAMAATKKIAIIHSEGIRLGLLFDSTSEILHVEDQNISLFDSKTESKKIILGALKLNGGDRIIEIIDPQALVKIENVPSVLERTKSNQSEVHKRSKRLQCITFRSQETTFAFGIDAIREIIKVPEVQKQASGPDYGIGVVNLRGIVIPLVHFSQFMKMSEGTVVDKERQRIIILKQNNVHFGFLVDSVDNIVSYYEDDLLPIPLFQQQKIEVFKGLLNHDLSGDVLFLDDTKILSHQEVLQLTHGVNTIYGQEQEAQKKAKSSVRVPYLSFKLEHLFSSQLRQVDEIAVIPPDIMKPPGYPEFVSGVLKMRGDLVTVIDLRKLYGMNPLSETIHSRLLIINTEKAKLGLVVDSVESIENLDESSRLTIPTIAVAGGAHKALQTVIKEVVEMTDVKGQKKTFMILDMSTLISKVESLFSQAS